MNTEPKTSNSPSSSNLPWWIDTYSLIPRRVFRAHVVTDHHLGAGWYKTLCGKTEINTEYRARVKPEDWTGLNVKKCKDCEREVAEVEAASK